MMRETPVTNPTIDKIPYVGPAAVTLLAPQKPSVNAKKMDAMMKKIWKDLRDMGPDFL